MKHANVSIFIPHNGCPHQCSFCNQRTITGQNKQPSIEELNAILQKAENELINSNKEAQIAFFGGSFTAIDKSYMNQLSDTAFPYIKKGSFTGIRISTRPDAIDDNILSILKSKGVTDIELGCQSMDDKVLKKNQRGHTENDIISASKQIKEYGFSLGLQMMTGLYGSTVNKDIETADKIINLKPSVVRIYPTVIMNGTLLAELYLKGNYVPYAFDETVELCALLLQKFDDNNIPVIRLGLHYSKELELNRIAGAYHPAFREVCENKMLLNKILKRLNYDNIAKGDIEIQVSPKNISKAIGQKKCNLLKLKNMGFNAVLKQNQNITNNDILINVKH